MKRSWLLRMVYTWLLVPLVVMTPDNGIAAPKTETATFAGGCFWCMESPFDKLDGVLSVTVGYTGGWVKNPTYE